LIGISWDLSTPLANGIVSVNPSNVSDIQMIKRLGEKALAITEAAYDPTRRIFYLLTGGGVVLEPVQIRSGNYLPSVTIDVSGCSGGNACLEELIYNPDTNSIIATGVGYGAAPTSVAAVSISVVDGSVTTIGYVRGTCALTLDASTLDVAGQIYYLTADCGDDEHDSTVFAFNIARPEQPLPFVLNGTAYYDTNPLFVGRGSVLYALNGVEEVVRIHNNVTSTIANSTVNVGGIPANHGVAVDTDGSTAWMSLTHYTNNLLVSVNLATGTVAAQPFPYTLEHLVYDGAGRERNVHPSSTAQDAAVAVHTPPKHRLAGRD